MGWLRNTAEQIREALAARPQEREREEEHRRAAYSYPQPERPAGRQAQQEQPRREAGAARQAEGVTHTGPGTVNITGQAIGQPGAPARGQGRTAGHREADASGGEPGAPYVVNSGRHGQINMDRTAVGPGAHVSIRGGEVEFGSSSQPTTREPGRDLGPHVEPEAG